MRTLLISIAVLTLLPVFCSATSMPVLTLTDTNGVSATGKVITYFPHRGLIKIRQNDKSCLFSVPALTPESQMQIERWQADKAFESRSSLDVSFQKKNTHSTSNITGTVTDRMTNEKTEKTIGYEKREFCKYKIKVTNKSDIPFDELIADYRVFFTQQLTEEYTGKYQLAGSEMLDQLAAGTSWNFFTTKFLSGITYQAADGIIWTGMPTSSFPEVLGVLLHIRKRGQDGEWIDREIEHGDVPRRRDREDYQKVYE
jgi:hypothetical protein